MNLFTKQTTQASSDYLENSKHKINVSLTRKNAWLLWLCQCLNIAVIALELSSWMLAIISLSLVWQALLLHQNRDSRKTKQQNSHVDNSKQHSSDKIKKQQVGQVSPILLGMFAVLGCLALAITAKEVGILTTMVQLLCFSYVLKAFELKTRSDFYQLLLLGLFVLSSSLIFRQDLAFSFIVLSLLVINFAVLLQYFSFESTFVTNIKVVMILLGQSILLASILFLVFPRLSPFWQVPKAKSNETGLSDTVKPGDIANLTRSTKLAFRTDFGQQKVPEYSQLYWRAVVLENYDGKQWSKQESDGIKTTNKIDDLAKKSLIFDASTTEVNPLNYQVIVEPSFQKYLFALAPAVVTGDKSGIRAESDFTFSSSRNISQAKSYQLTSYLTAPFSLELTQKSKQVNLKYPKGSNPRLESFAQQLQYDYVDVQARAQAVLTFINKENYEYTLQPPLLENNSLDQFFFETKSGFCAHYASAFTFLMRASGIPARMVTGYLGGEFNGDTAQEVNPEGHMSIYQYDAHAWSEIWVVGRGWLRIDPTSAVDLERINSGWSSELLQEQSALNDDLLSLYQLKNTAWLNALRLQFDALDYQWTRWVIGFTTKQQYNLFNDLFGKMAAWKLATIIAVSLIVSMTMLMLFLHLINRVEQKKIPLAKWQIFYHKALTQLAKQGIKKPTGMTVNDFAKQVREQSPELAIVFTRLSTSYNRLCYQTLTINEQTKIALTMQQQYQQLLHTLKQQQ